MWDAGSCHCGLPVLIDHKMGTDQVGRGMQRDNLSWEREHGYLAHNCILDASGYGVSTTFL